MSEESYITLGDGDFTYSLDLLRYLISRQADAKERKQKLLKNGTNDAGKKNGSNVENCRPRLVATSIDSLSDLRNKYHDIDSILNKINKLSSPSTKKKKHLTHEHKLEGYVSMQIKHCVNAIVSMKPATKEKEEKNECNQTQVEVVGEKNNAVGSRFDHVIFNFPHLGVEDAKLHHRFLSHFFFSCFHHWLKEPGGVLHLTLANGQYDRWKCQDASERHGFKLLSRCSFTIPPLDAFSSSSEPEPSAYQHRRHQNGKSFRSKIDHGETFTFGRKQTNDEEEKYVSVGLPWQPSKEASSSSSLLLCHQGERSRESPPNRFRCPFCPKVFREERSRKNHVKSVHVHEDPSSTMAVTANTITSIKATPTSFSCPICHTNRSFGSAEALHAHMQAKHLGLFHDIKPDWCRPSSVCRPNESISRRSSDSEEEKKNPTSGTAATRKPSSSLSRDERSEDAPAPNHNPPFEGKGKGQPESSSPQQRERVLGLCEVCGFRYATSHEKRTHMQEFNPFYHETQKTNSCNDSGGDGEPNPLDCVGCHKRFRDTRALFQHTNFCLAVKTKYAENLIDLRKLQDTIPRITNKQDKELIEER